MNPPRSIALAAGAAIFLLGPLFGNPPDVARLDGPRERDHAEQSWLDNVAKPQGAPAVAGAEDAANIPGLRPGAKSAARCGIDCVIARREGHAAAWLDHVLPKSDRTPLESLRGVGMSMVNSIVMAYDFAVAGGLRSYKKFGAAGLLIGAPLAAAVGVVYGAVTGAVGGFINTMSAAVGAAFAVAAKVVGAKDGSN